MNSKTIISLCIIVITSIGLLFVLTYERNPVSENTVVIPPEAPITLCYAYDQKQPSGFTDRAFLKMNLTGPDGTQVTGEYNNLPAEKDSKVGTFTGTVGPMHPEISARTADVWWNAMAEGMTVTEQLKIVFGEGSATAQFGEMIDRGDGTYLYKDTTNLTNGFQMSQVDCTDLDDIIMVESTLKQTLATIAPKQPVLGGTWYVTSVHVNPSNDTGTVTYEDGHIQETSTFSYSITSGQVTITFLK